MFVMNILYIYFSTASCTASAQMHTQPLQTTCCWQKSVAGVQVVGHVCPGKFSLFGVEMFDFALCSGRPGQLYTTSCSAFPKK